MEFELLKRVRTLGLWLDWKNKSFASASRFFVHFFAVATRYNGWKCLISRFVQDVNKDSDFLVLFLNFDVETFDELNELE